MKYVHKILNNQTGNSNFFDGKRGFDNEDDDDPEETPKDYQYQKEILSNAIIRFDADFILKYERRRVDIPFSVDYIRIDFLVTFDNFNEFKTRDRFRNEFGLRDIHYFHFNRSVLFEVEDKDKCNKLLNYIEEYTLSKDTNPLKESYAIVTIIQSFELLTREHMLARLPELKPTNNAVTFQLTMHEDTTLEYEKGELFKLMMNYLASFGGELEIKMNGEHFLSLSGISRSDLVTLIDNYDVIASVQAVRFPGIRPITGGNSYRTFGFQIIPVSNDVPLVAVIDNGVNPIPPLQNSLANFGETFDIVYPPYQTQGWHGTAVAVIAATGECFFNGESELAGDCKIVSCRVFERDGGHIDFADFERMIRVCYDKGVRLFNFSVNEFFKPYNSDYSYFSYLLDKLSYEMDILFFISAGNLDGSDLENIYLTMSAGEHHPALKYPKHFFYPDANCLEHSCDGTNLKTPAESLNNLTIGALADNLNRDSSVDMTLDKYLPAYYSSKYHVSPFHKVNGSRLKSRHINYKLFKPDIVYPGGDYGYAASGIQLCGSGIGNDQFRQECGTSFAAPFAANLAARIARTYPKISVQTIKALIINCAQPLTDSFFLEDHLKEMKERFAAEEFNKPYEELTNSELMKVNKWFHKEDIFNRLTGHGMPDTQVSLSSSNKSITIIIEDQIRLGSHKAIPIHLPTYLLQATKKTTIMDMQATLCFKFQPNFKDQTGYNPLHISFNFLKSFDSPEQTATLASHSKDLPFYDRLYEGIIDPKARTAKRNETLAVKKSITSWSDDFFPNGRQFSNCQKLRMPINLNDLIKTENELSLIVRCTGKTEANFETKSFLEGNHHFSLVITLKEEAGKSLADYDFYNEFLQINQTLDAISDIELGTDLDAEA